MNISVHNAIVFVENGAFEVVCYSDVADSRKAEIENRLRVERLVKSRIRSYGSREAEIALAREEVDFNSFKDEAHELAWTEIHCEGRFGVLAVKAGEISVLGYGEYRGKAMDILAEFSKEHGGECDLLLGTGKTPDGFSVAIVEWNPPVWEGWPWKTDET